MKYLANKSLVTATIFIGIVSVWFAADRAYAGEDIVTIYEFHSEIAVGKPTIASFTRILRIQNRSAAAQGKTILNLDAERTAKDRQIILSNLYERLQASDSKETSERLIQAIEKIWLTSGSDTIDLLMARASSAFDKNKLKLAKQLLDSITDLDPNYSEGWSKRAMLAFKQDDYLSSLKDLEKVLALDPRHFRAIQGVGLILQQFGKKKQALELYRKVLKINPFSEAAQQAENELAREVEGQGI